jgi:hypothetical protein
MMACPGKWYVTERLLLKFWEVANLNARASEENNRGWSLGKF